MKATQNHGEDPAQNEKAKAPRPSNMVKRLERIEKKKISKGRKPKVDKSSTPKQLLITPDEFNRQLIPWLSGTTLKDITNLELKSSLPLKQTVFVQRWWPNKLD